MFGEDDAIRIARQMEAHQQAIRDYSHLQAEIERSQAFVREYERIEGVLKHRDIIESAVEAARLAAAADLAFGKRTRDVIRAVEEQERWRRSVGEIELLYVQSRSAALATVLLHDELIRLSGPAFRPLLADLDRLTRSGALVLGQLSERSSYGALTAWHLQAPTLLPYAAASSLVALGVANGSLVEIQDELDGALDHLESRVAQGLAQVSPDLVTPYRGAVRALRAGGPDWQRHLGASLRTVVDGLLDQLAPEEELERFINDPGKLRIDGKVSRRAQLLFIFRDVAIHGYARMAENDIEMVLATFYPTNAAVHELVPNLSEKQGRVLLRRVQGCLATILATIERDSHSDSME